VGGATLEDDTEFLPDKSWMLYADSCNQQQKQIAAVGKIVDICEISIEILAGVPTITNVVAPGTNVVIGSFDAPVDNADGDTTITWPEGTLPPASGKPYASIDTDGSFTTHAANVTNGVLVKTRNSTTGALADANFTVRIR
jgi:hypothetical protein